MTIFETFDTTSNQSELEAQTYVLTDIGGQPVAFLSSWVTEILSVERARILAVPFYGSALLGLFPHQGKIVSLVQLEQILTRKKVRLPSEENLNTIYLSSQVKSLAGIGIVVSRVLGSYHYEALARAASANQLETAAVKIFESNLIPDTLWQPQS